MEKKNQISLKFNFTPNNLGCYGLKIHSPAAGGMKYWLKENVSNPGFSFIQIEGR